MCNINSAWVADRNVKCKHFQRKQQRGTSLGLGPRSFQTKQQKPSQLKQKVGISDFIKIVRICSVEEPVKRMKRHAADWRKIFADRRADRGHVLGYRKTFKHSTIKEQTAQLKKQAKDTESSQQKGYAESELAPEIVVDITSQWGDTCETTEEWHCTPVQNGQRKNSDHTQHRPERGEDSGPRPSGTQVDGSSKN